jgi:hypothetical protein
VQHYFTCSSPFGQLYLHPSGTAEIIKISAHLGRPEADFDSAGRSHPKCFHTRHICSKGSRSGGGRSLPTVPRTSRHSPGSNRGLAHVSRPRRHADRGVPFRSVFPSVSNCPAEMELYNGRQWDTTLSAAVPVHLRTGPSSRAFPSDSRAAGSRFPVRRFGEHEGMAHHDC